MPNILVVDDETSIIELAKLYLKREGFQVDGVTSGQEALAVQNASSPDLIVLDLMLPDIDGFEICRQIRAKSSVPILMLTARKEDVDKIVGLELGADDYLTKPFNPREFVARVKAILRRYQAGKSPSEVIEMGGMRIDLARHETTLKDQKITLRTKEFALLVMFAQNPGIVFSREQLLESVWGYDFYGETRTVDVHVNHLREKLAGSGIIIETMRGIGYKMTAEEKQ